MWQQKRVISMLILLSCLLIGSRIGMSLYQTSAPPPPDRQFTAWVEKSLRRMQTVKVGMTRQDLLRVFTTEGGLSTALRQTYAYRECPYIKVDVEFEPVGRPARDAEGRVTSIEGDDDVIKNISKPYLAWRVLD